jgi:membrane fusion protein (multidrug efflux system)
MNSLLKSYSAPGLLLAAVACLVVGCADGTQTGGFEMPPMPVEAASVTRRTVTDDFTAVGTLGANKSIEVVAEIDGKVMDLPFREGSYTEAGELIAQLDDVQLKAERDRAAALLEQQQVTFDRVKELVAQNLAAKQDLDNAAAAYKVAEANLALAQARLDKTRVVAPFAGFVGARRVSLGEFLQIGDAITDLAQFDELKAEFTAPERYLSQLRRGATVTVTSPAFPDLKLAGQINVISPVVDPSTRSVAIVAHLPNRERLLRPGMSANISVVLSRREGSLVIPSEAVFAEGNQMFVFAIGDDGVVAKTAVTLGSRSASDVEVMSGLSEGQQIVKAGHQKLFPGAKVFVAGAPGSMPPGGAPPGGATPGEAPDPAQPAPDSAAVGS